MMTLDNRLFSQRSAKAAICAGVGLSLCLGLAQSLDAQYDPEDPIEVPVVPVAAGLDQVVGTVDQIFPTDLVPFPDGSGRLLVSTLGGLLRLIDDSGTLRAAPFHDTTSAVTINADNGNSSFGLTTVVFHPDFASVGQPGFGRFYTVEPEITRTNPPPDFPGIGSDQGGSNPAHDRVLYAYTVDDLGADIFTGDKREVLRIHEHRRGHDVNDLAFDANGYLLIACGDTVVSGSAQDLSNVFGTVLRIDPLDPGTTPASLDPPSANGAYRVPADNPFRSDPLAIDEIFIYGLRNPYRMSVDASGQIWISSNGNSQRESVYVASAGDNLGWPFFEGTRPNQTAPPGFVFAPPIFEYDHGLGRSVNGVFAYRGTGLPSLAGRVVFADFLGVSGGGARLFHGDSTTGVFSDVEAAPGGPSLPSTVVSLGEDQAGEIYVLSIDGTVSRLGAVGNPPVFSDGFESGDLGQWSATVP